MTDQQPTTQADKFRYAVLGVLAGLSMIAGGAYIKNDIIVGTGLSKIGRAHV